MYSVDTMVEGSFGALGTVLVGAAVMLLGYTPLSAGQSINTLAPTARTLKMISLAQGLFLVAVIPWTLCVILYTLVYKNYPRDSKKIRMILEQRARELKRRKQ